MMRMMIALCKPMQFCCEFRTLRWQSTYDHTHFACLHFYPGYSKLHFSTLWTTVENYISQLFSFQISVIWLCFSAFGKTPFSHLWIQFLNMISDHIFCFCESLCYMWPQKLVSALFDILYSFFFKYCIFYTKIPFSVRNSIFFIISSQDAN